jgi:hypothetical protein
LLAIPVEWMLGVQAKLSGHEAYIETPSVNAI